MNLSLIQRWGGISIIIGSMLYMFWAIFYAALLPLNQYSKDLAIVVMSPHWIWISAIALPGTILMIFGFTAIYSRLYSSSGIMGFFGYIFVVTAFLFQTASITWEVFLYPPIVSYGPSIALFREGIFMKNQLLHWYYVMYDGTIGIGVILFSITLIKSREFPIYAGILFFCGVLAYAIGSWLNVYFAVAGVIILSTGCFILGKRLFTPGLEMIK
jgi:hypothetical protein